MGARESFPVVRILVRATTILLTLTCLVAPGIGAQESGVVDSEKIERDLTRDIGIAPKLSAQGYAVPQASPHVSLNTILFDLDSARVRDESIPQLNELVAALRSEKLKGFRLLVEGHTCSRGTAEHNQVLSEQRAESVKSYLMAHGIAANRLETRGWGLTRPVAPNTDEAHMRLNRRVDFIRLESATMVAVNSESRSVVTRGMSGSRFLEAKFSGQKKGGGPVFALAGASNPLTTGDLFQIQFTVLEGCHVYVLFLSSQGEVFWMFPTEDVQFGRWCYFGEKHTLPDADKWNVLDESVGTETVFLIAAAAPLPDANALPALIKKLGSALNSASFREATGVQESEVQTLVIDHR
jgi:outer membrane protein OmpA-like peptidoglycan-associated protein